MAALNLRSRVPVTASRSLRAAFFTSASASEAVKTGQANVDSVPAANGNSATDTAASNAKSSNKSERKDNGASYGAQQIQVSGLQPVEALRVLINVLCRVYLTEDILDDSPSREFFYVPHHYGYHAKNS